MRTTVTKVTCDRCDAPIEGNIFHMLVLGTMDTEDTEAWADVPEHIDLCPECAAYLLNIATNNEKPEAKEEKKKAKPKKKAAPRIDYGRVKALYDAGWKVKAIADDLGCTTDPIYRFLRMEAEEHEVTA